MNSNTNSTKMEAKTAEGSFCPVAYATVLAEGWERVVKVSKTSLDFAVEKNAEVLASYQKVMKVPGPSLFDLAGRALKGYVTIQKNLLDLGVEQNAVAVQARAENIPSSLDCMDAAPTSNAAEQIAGTEEQHPGLSSASLQTDSDPESVQLRKLAKEIVDATLPMAKTSIQ